MKKYIIIALIGSLATSVYAQEKPVNDSLPMTVQLGYQVTASGNNLAGSARGINAEVLEQSPEIDIAKALYGKIAGLNVYQGSGSNANNIPSLSIHGNAPLVIIDGFPRSLSDITAPEIESVQILKDAVATALYGVRGGNGVVIVTTKHGHVDKLKVSAQYQYGLSTQFRKPEFADAYTYAESMNTALTLDGLNPRYNNRELAAFKNNTFPYEYPNVNWWNEVYNKISSNHRLSLTFDGGSERFRYYSVIDYMHDKAFYKEEQSDERYNTKPSDVRLNIRTNIDVDLTPKTSFKIGLLGKLQETNSSYNIGNTENGESIFSEIIYRTPSAAFPVQYADGIYGGNSIYSYNNPVALLESTGDYRTTYGTLLANASLRQELDVLLKGFSAEVSVAFDNTGAMYDSSSRNYQYTDSQASILDDGTLVTTPVTYGKNSGVIEHGNSKFKSLFLRSNIQAKINYRLSREIHDIRMSLVYDQQSYMVNNRNKSSKRQSMLMHASYTYDNRYLLNGVLNYSGTAYLPEGERFHLYPAISAGWIASNEKFFAGVKPVNLLKIYASFGISGYDGNMQHELYRQSYSSSGGYYFTQNSTAQYGLAEGRLPVENLVPEKSKKATYGIELNAFGNRLSVYMEGFYERRSNILIQGSSSISGIIGVDVGKQCEGIQEYKGFDTSIGWNGHIGKDFNYGISANASYIDSKVIRDDQEYQAYDYLYTQGNRVGQKYGLEVIGFFRDQTDINNSPAQTFSTVRPGDLKYKDQNGDNRIDEQDKVKMFGSSIPRFYFGFNLNASYKNFELSADFQGMTGITTSLLNSPLYKPLVNNGNISHTFLDNETPWTPENAANATMPRLTTQTNANNYQPNSLWYRDGSFLKLRNLYIAYTLPRKLLRFADMKIYLQGTNLFSLDNISFADPEMLGADYPSIRSYWMGVKFNF
ncbi:SusC/RagA family TonB-linked outer membrane protein [uncultured Bacteroides sp.]|uniref:SusC/RagA family TonB-linked outer membrane protein n=1 Tax=uncultured Bacteroides sp. TaxID=162156 RepID=UPI002674DB68|nr:SusC/RagA family TonB-linked outer membrane protein [uncultured Bacteroides sp.]